MNFFLDNAFDEHWLYVCRYQKTSFNIVVRAMIDRCFDEKHLIQSLELLKQRHPYLVSPVVENKYATTTPRFSFEYDEQATLSHHMNAVSSAQLIDIFSKLSERRTHLFDLESGKLAHMQVWHDQQKSLLEFSCAHLLGDVTAILLLFKDFLAFLDGVIRQAVLPVSKQQRLTFDEKRYGWATEISQVAPLHLPDGAPTNPDIWPSPNFMYEKHAMTLEQFNLIKLWLRQQHSDAAVTDVFYYLAVKMYHEAGENNLNFSFVLSFRQLLDGIAEQNNINTSVVFSPIDKDNLEDMFAWLKKLDDAKQIAISQAGIMGLMNFLRSLNASLYDAPPELARALINAYLPINLFAFNNFGKVDDYFNHTLHFKVTDIDIQDGVPCQEVRLFTFKKHLHMHSMLSPAGPFTSKAFWDKYFYLLNQLIQQ